MGRPEEPVKLGSPGDVNFIDPTGQYGAALERMLSESNWMKDQFAASAGQGAPPIDVSGISYDPEAATRRFLASAPGISNLVSGATSSLETSLRDIARREATLGGEAALAGMPGLRNSGAAMAAYGSAYADPFARVVSDIQGRQLGLTGSLWGQSMADYAAGEGARVVAEQSRIDALLRQRELQQQEQALYGQLYGQTLSGYGQIAAGMGGMWQPQYYVPEQRGPNWGGGFTGAAAGLAGGAVLGPVGAGVGAGLGLLGGLFA